jgi:phosphatidate cytidylyltransferase
MGQLFVALPLSLLNFIYYKNPLLLLAIFIFIWLNDTGAYCVGSLIGKHRLFERISPKKSWEGFWGGLILCVISGIAIATWLNSYFNGPQLYGWIVLAAIVSIFSTWGDLCESLIKRSIGVKDSGKILPGHGGILDRIDSLLLVSPTALLFFTILELISK